MSYQVIRREGTNVFTARCGSCGAVQTVRARRLLVGCCRSCDLRHAQWQAELMAPYGQRPASR